MRDFKRTPVPSELWHPKANQSRRNTNKSELKAGVSGCNRQTHRPVRRPAGLPVAFASRNVQEQVRHWQRRPQLCFIGQTHKSVRNVHRPPLFKNNITLKISLSYVNKKNQKIKKNIFWLRPMVRWNSWGSGQGFKWAQVDASLQVPRKLQVWIIY